VNISTKIKLLCDHIASISALQDFVNNFIHYQFADQANDISRPKLYLVGGAVRDFFFGRELKDYDFVIQGVNKDELDIFLQTVPGKLMDIESRNFGVFKLKLADCDLDFLDIALPRIDIYDEYGRGHKDVQVQTSANLTIDDDLARRDFTINAMAVDLINCQLIDPFNGLSDLENKIIKAVGHPHDRLVDEDPTRMLRALRFAAKYDFQIEAETYDTICQHHSEINKKFVQQYRTKQGTIKQRTIERVSRDIIASEFIKGFFHQPHRMIELLDQTGVYQEIFSPKIVDTWVKMKTTDQPKNYHAEGSVWNHTMLALRNIDKLSSNQLGLPTGASINLKLAVWLHDFGKVDTFKIDSTGNYTYYNHPQVSGRLAADFFSAMKVNSMFGADNQYHVCEKDVIFVIENHMLPFGPDVEGMKDSTIAKYYLQETVPVNQDFEHPQSHIAYSQRGVEVLQMAYIDANSAIKSYGEQDFTGIKRMISKIDRVLTRLQEFSRNQKIYPVDGHLIKEILLEIGQQNDDQKIIQIGQHGGRLIGQLLDYILEDALNNPAMYKNQDTVKTQAALVVSQYLKDNY